MKSLDDLSLSLKLALGPAVCLLLLATAALCGLWGFEQQRSVLDSVVKQRLPAYTFASSFESGLRDLNGLVNSSLGFEAMGYNARDIAVVDQELQRVSTALQAALKAQLAQAGDGPQAAPLQALAQRFARYDKALKDTLDMKSSGPAIASTYLSTAAKEYKDLLAEIARMSQAKLDETGQDVAAASQSAHWMQIVIAAASLTALALGLLLSIVLARGMMRRVKALSAAAGALADGDLSHAVTAQGRDELGRLMGDLEQVRHRLAASIHLVRQATDSVRDSAGEIAAGNADLSQRTERQAGNLQQTASAMEQLHATVKNNADAARQAAQMAQAASRVALKGGEVVGRMVATMGDISSSSRRIADIIGTIDGIAFQTNILALNAAVEAARAGDQGRGFAVVAGEVRGLAMRSANAAKEIKSLIQASVERVAAGADLAAGAGDAMKDIVGQVASVSDLIGRISAVTDQQTAGIGEVGGSIQAIDTTTQQNAALVEQSAAAAESLRQQTVRLSDAVGVFRLAEEADAVV